MEQFYLNDFKRDFTCGLDTCYEKSKQTKQVCRRIFDDKGRSVFDHFSAELSVSLFFPSIMTLLVVLVVTSAVGSSIVRYYNQRTTDETNKCHSDQGSKSIV